MMRWIGVALLAVGGLGALGHVLALSALADISASLSGAALVTGAIFFASDVIARRLVQLLTAAGIEDDHVGG